MSQIMQIITLAPGHISCRSNIPAWQIMICSGNKSYRSSVQGVKHCLSCSRLVIIQSYYLGTRDKHHEEDHKTYAVGFTSSHPREPERSKQNKSSRPKKSKKKKKNPSTHLKTTTPSLTRWRGPRTEPERGSARRG